MERKKEENKCPSTFYPILSSWRIRTSRSRLKTCASEELLMIYLAWKFQRKNTSCARVLPKIISGTFIYKVSENGFIAKREPFFLQERIMLVGTLASHFVARFSLAHRRVQIDPLCVRLEKIPKPCPSTQNDKWVCQKTFDRKGQGRCRIERSARWSTRLYLILWQFLKHSNPSLISPRKSQFTCLPVTLTLMKPSSHSDALAILHFVSSLKEMGFILIRHYEL